MKIYKERTLGGKREHKEFLLRFVYVFFSAILITTTLIYINYMNYALNDLGLLDRGRWRSLTIYLSGMFIFMCLFLIFNILLYCFWGAYKKEGFITNCLIKFFGGELSGYAQFFLVAFNSLVGIGILYHYMAVNQRSDPGFNEGNFYCIPAEAWEILCIIVFIFALVAVWKKVDIGKIEKYFIYVISIFFTFFPVFITNPFFEGTFTQGYRTVSFVNFSIVWETIYNVIDGVPFTLDTTPLYGHYGLFFLLPLKLVGKENYIIAISFMFALMACVEQVAVLYVIDTFSPKNWISALLALASVARLSYYVVHLTPIRTFFPMLLFAFFTYLYKHKKKIMTKFACVVSFLLLTLSLLCNPEICAACMIGYVAFVVFELICGQVSLRGFIVSGGKVLLICILSIVSAIGIVNVYNMACGGPMILREFFFPLVGGDTNIVNYIQDHFDWPVPLGNFAWEYILIFLLATVCVAWYLAIRCLKGHGKNEDSIAPIIGGMACTGIVAFAYYMNEPLWTDLVVYKHIVYGLFAVLLGKIYVLFEKNNYPHISHQFMRVFGIVMVSVTICGAVQLINDPVRIAARKWAGAYDTATLKAEVSQLDIPEDTYGIGQGVNMIYHMLGMDNHAKFRDTSELDMPYSQTFEKVIDELKQNDTALINFSNPYDQDMLSKLQARGFTFTPLRSFKIGSWVYTYCTIDYNDSISFTQT